MPIKADSPEPIYLQIVAEIQQAVAAGVYRPGEAIPSVRALAVELRVNPNTVQRAYEALERAGVVRAHKGKGMFVTQAGAASAQARAESAVQSAFEQGLQIARSAGLPAEQVRAAYDRAWRARWGESASGRTMP